MKDNSNIKINVIGIGGGGGNSIINTYDKIYDLGLDLSFFVVNTDMQALSLVGKRRIRQIVVGRENFKGIGAGANPSKAYNIVKDEGAEVFDPIFANDPSILFISVGLGGGTGSGVTPLITELAKKRGVLTVIFGTFPWGFEGEQREKNALLSLRSLVDYADSIIIVNNDFLNSEGTTKSLISDLFKKTDEWLKYSILTIASLILEKSIINIDFNDITTALKDSGFGFFFIMDKNLNKIKKKGKTDEDDANAIYEALKGTFIENLDVSKSTYMVVNVSGNKDTLSMGVINNVLNKIKVDSPNINILFGLSFNPYMENGQIQISGLFAGVTYDIKSYDSLVSLQEMYKDKKENLLMEEETLAAAAKKTAASKAKKEAKAAAKAEEAATIESEIILAKKEAVASEKAKAVSAKKEAAAAKKADAAAAKAAIASKKDEVSSKRNEEALARKEEASFKRDEEALARKKDASSKKDAAAAAKADAAAAKKEAADAKAEAAADAKADAAEAAAALKEKEETTDTEDDS